MATVTVIPLGAYGPGTITLGPAAVPLNPTQMILTVQTDLMLDPATSFDLRLQLSLDNGGTYADWGGATRNGGPVLIGKDGLPLTTASFVVSLPDPTNTQRKIKGTLTIVGTVTTSGTLTLR